MSLVVGLQYTATKFQLHWVLTMTKQGKLRIKRLRIPSPKDQERTRTLPRCLGVRLPSHGGRLSRSLRFGKAPTLFFCTCRPHPRSSIGAKPLQNRVGRLPINRMI